MLVDQFCSSSWEALLDKPPRCGAPSWSHRRAQPRIGAKGCRPNASACSIQAGFGPCGRPSGSTAFNLLLGRLPYLVEARLQACFPRRPWDPSSPWEPSWHWESGWPRPEHP